jgi:hypothetical protein
MLLAHNTRRGPSLCTIPGAQMDETTRQVYTIKMQRNPSLPFTVVCISSEDM